MAAIRQPIPKVLAGVGYGGIGGTTHFSGINDGDGNAVNQFSRSPMPVGGTIRSLVVTGGGTRPGDVIVTVMVNGVATDLAATLVVGATSASNPFSEIIVSQGDYVEYRIVTAAADFPGFSLGLFVEFEGTRLAFGIAAATGTVSNGDQGQGGALGNGYWSLAGSNSPTYSIAAIAATVTRLVLRRWASSTGGEWIGQMRLNGVIQDGSGGTVNTTCMLDDDEGSIASSNFLLPIVPTDHVEVLITRTTTGVAFAQHILGAGIAVLPDVDGQAMLCGGDNSVIPSTGTTWKWNNSAQEGASEFMHTASAGLRQFHVLHGYIERSVGPGDSGSFIHRLTKNSTATDIIITLTGSDPIGDDDGEVTFNPGDVMTLEIENVDSPADARLHWSFALGPLDSETEDDEPEGVIGELAWWHRRKRLTDGTIVTTVHSDWDMQCPDGWYGGFKEGTVIEFGDAERTASDPVTGDWKGATFRLRQADTTRTLLSEFASAAFRYWVGNNPVYMTTRANRALLGTAYCVFNGPIIDAQTRGLAWDITLGDVISRQLVSDEALIPWRQFKDSNLSQFIEVSETLDREAPEQIIYGQHFRVPDVDPASPQGFIYTPTLMGKFEVAGDAWWCWQVCGHAVADLVDVYVIEQTPEGPEPPGSITADEGTTWLIPHYAGFFAQFGAPYEDVVSDTYGTTRRVTRIYGKVGEADPDACAIGTKILAVAVEGVEPFGDGSGEVVTDRIQQYKHFAINYLAHSGADSYHTGLWATNPVWDLPEGPLGIIDEDAFDDVSAIAEERLPAVGGSPSLYPAGYIGAAIIGAHGGDRLKAPTWIAEWNVSCGVRQGFDHFGRLTIGILHPTQAIKDAAPLITDEFVIIKDSFETPIAWTQHGNRQPFEADYEHVTGRWMTSDAADSAASQANYDRIILADARRYRFAPGISMAFHLAHIAVVENEHPPRGVVLEGTIGPDPNGDSLGYLDLFQYFRYRHFASISEDPRAIRLAWIIKHQVQAGKRKVRIEAIDVDDLIYYDAPPFDDSSGGGSPSGSPGSPGSPPSGGSGPSDLVTGPQVDITCS